ncbi:helix-turn-helix domain-containing protein [Phenylobacterium sp.]|uniref:helix-turn-helix domain-containing protein n=1 Tax=Phenylobacterium sp. TaxID=1871053 RepID=UPI0025E8F2B1|nr:helix-turn-helix domain-containing protein [Phenylobacterium sp.]
MSRGLAALTALNERGPLSLGDLSAMLALPRTTTRRILTTLVAENCCLRLPSSRLYALAPGVQRLTGGYSVIDRITAACVQVLPVLSQETGWPASLAIPDGLVMRVRVSTDFASPFALARMRPGYTAPQVETTTGLLYLASLDAAEAARRLDEIYAAAWRSPLRFARDEVERLMARARRDHALVLQRRFPEASLGVPLRIGGRVEGGLVLRYVRSAVPLAEARSRLLPRLRDAAASVIAYVADQAARNGAVTGS